MCSIGTPGFYTAPTDMKADQRILARVGPGTESAAFVTGVSPDGRFVNLRVFPDQGEPFHLQGIGFGDNEQLGSFTNLIEHQEPAEGETAGEEQQQADARREKKRADKTPEKRQEEAEKKREEEKKQKEESNKRVGEKLAEEKRKNERDTKGRG